MDSASDADSVDVLLYDAETGTIDDALSVETYASVVVAEPHSDSALAMLRAALQGARVRPLIVELLQDIAEGEGVPRARFIDALAHAADATDANMTDDGDDVLESYASAAAFVYDAIVEASAHDLSVAGDVSPRALIAGLSVMVTGDQDEVVEVVFAAFDDDRDNSLSIRELEGFLRTVLALSLRLKSVGEDDTAAPHGALGEKAVKMAKSMARRTFATMDVDHSQHQPRGVRVLAALRRRRTERCGRRARSAADAGAAHPTPHLGRCGRAGLRRRQRARAALAFRARRRARGAERCSREHERRAHRRALRAQRSADVAREEREGRSRGGDRPRVRARARARGARCGR